MNFFDDIPAELFELIILAFLTTATARDIAILLRVSRVFNNEIQRIIGNSDIVMEKWRTTHNHKFAIRPIACNPKLSNPSVLLPWVEDISYNDPANYLSIYHLDRVLDDPHRKFIVPIGEMKTATYEKNPPCSRNTSIRRYFNGSYILYDGSIWDIMQNKTYVFPEDVELWCHGIWDFRDCGDGFAIFAIVKISSYSVFVIDMKGDANHTQHEITMPWPNVSLIGAACFAVSCNEFVAAFVNKNVKCDVVYKKGISEWRFIIDGLPKRLTKFQVGITRCAFYVVANDNLYVYQFYQTRNKLQNFKIHTHDPKHHRAILKDGTILDMGDIPFASGVVFRHFKNYEGCLGFTGCLIGKKYAIVVWDDQVILADTTTGATVALTDKNSFKEVAFQVMKRYDDILINIGNTLMVLRELGGAACF